MSTCEGFTDKKTGKVWDHSDVIKLVKTLQAQVKSLKSGSSKCSASYDYGIRATDEDILRVINESKERIRSGKLQEASVQEKNPPNTAGYNNYYMQIHGRPIPEGYKVESESTRIKSAAKERDKIPACYRTYENIGIATYNMQHGVRGEDREEKGKILSAAEKSVPSSWNNFRRLITGDVI